MSKVIDINEKLKLVVHNKKLEKAKVNQRGKDAVAILLLHNKDAERLLIVEDDLFNKRISQSTHEYIRWYLEELLMTEPATPLQEVMYSWAAYLLEYLKAGNAKVIKPRKQKSKKPIPPAK